MRIERKGTLVLFNGNTVSKRLLKSILDEFFRKEVQAEILAAIERDGYAECGITMWHGELPAALKCASKNRTARK